MYLLDTNIVSADAPARRHIGLDAFAAWMRKHSECLFISTLTVAEIEAGIARAVRIGATTKAERLRHWLAAVEHLYGARILPFDIDAARKAGAIDSFQNGTTRSTVSFRHSVLGRFSDEILA